MNDDTPRNVIEPNDGADRQADGGQNAGASNALSDRCMPALRHYRGARPRAWWLTPIVIVLIVGVGAVWTVVDVMKFANARETAFQHLDVGLRCNGFDIFRRHSPDEAIHQFAPGPEIVRGRTLDLGQPRHATLKSVTVNIRKPRQTDRMALVTALGVHSTFNTGNATAMDNDPYVACPSTW